MHVGEIQEASPLCWCIIQCERCLPYTLPWVQCVALLWSGISISEDLHTDIRLSSKDLYLPWSPPWILGLFPGKIKEKEKQAGAELG